jgi:hypothetical protein
MKRMSRRGWRNYIQGRGGEAPSPAKVNNTIRGWIEAYLKEANVTIEILETMLKAEKDDYSTASKIKVLIDRWKQIKHLCDETISKLD